MLVMDMIVDTEVVTEEVEEVTASTITVEAEDTGTDMEADTTVAGMVANTTVMEVVMEVGVMEVVMEVGVMEVTVAGTMGSDAILSKKPTK